MNPADSKWPQPVRTVHSGMVDMLIGFRAAQPCQPAALRNADRDEVWPKFLSGIACELLKLPA